MKNMIIVLILALIVGTAAGATSCRDNHQHCRFWADHNECQKNGKWMLPNCARSCQQCVLRGAVRSDTNPADPNCPVVQVQEVQTRIVPSGVQYRTRAQQLGCAISNQPNICSRNLCYHKKYRTLDGSCNNLNDPLKGAAYMPYSRIMPPNYEDGVNKMVGTTPGSRPNPRDVTVHLISSSIAISSSQSSLLGIFCQFLMHDITRNTLINTCTCGDRSAHCCNMPMARGDSKPGQCIPCTRSTPLCGTGSQGRPRQAMNEDTSFIDASNVYGSDPNTAQALRTGAFLRADIVGGKVFPPRTTTGLLTGDDRSTLFMPLAAMHSIFLRLHNRLCTEMTSLNPQWNQDRLYQEVRAIVGGIMQSIVYNHMVPALLGGKAKLIPVYKGYDANKDPGVIVELAGAAARLHGVVQENYPLVNNDFKTIGTYRVLEAAGDVSRLITSGAAAVLRGAITTPLRKAARITFSMTEFLFTNSDMSSLNIKRGRDLGLMNYNAYRQRCGLKLLTTFDDWPEVPDTAVRNRVKELYGHPDAIDLYVGGLMEEPQLGSVIGPTFSCIWAEQLVRLRDGDRFFYNNTGVFTPAQREVIHRVTLGDVLCEAGEDVRQIQSNVFIVDSGARVKNCGPTFDLSPWIDS